MGTKGLKRYTNGIDNKMFKEGCQPDGYYLGVSEEYRLNNSNAHKGQTAWNKGLTKETDDRVKTYSHPKSEEAKHNMSEARIRDWKDINYRENHLISMSTAEYKLAISKNQGLYRYNSLLFHSKPELEFYIYCVDHKINIKRKVEPIEYFINDKKHHYIPDFKVNDDLIEIKADAFLNNDYNLISIYKNVSDEILDAKSKCMKDNNVVIIRTSEMKKYSNYIDTTYGSDFLKQFKIN